MTLDEHVPANPRRLRVVVDHDVCVGNGTCVDLAPAAFELDADRQSVPRPGLSEVDEETIMNAATNCPVAAISVADADTGEQIFP